MAAQYSIAQARDHLARLVHGVEKGRFVELTRRGKPVAVLISARDYHRLRGDQPGFSEAVSRFLRMRGGEKSGLNEETFAGLRDRSPGREVRW